MQLAVRTFFAAAALLAGCSHDWDTYDPRLGQVSPTTSSATSASSGGSSTSTASGGPGGSGATGAGGAGGAGATGGGGSGGCDATAYKREVLADDPVGYWRLGDAVGAPTAADELGVTPGVVGSGTTFGVPGALACDGDTAAVLDGVTGQIGLGDAFDFVGSVPYTVEAWVKPTVLDLSYRRIFSKEAYDIMAQRQGYTAYARAPQPNAFGFERWLDGVTTAQLHADTSIPLDAWSHVVSVFDGKDCILYLDGVLVVGIGFAMPADIIDQDGIFTWGASSGGSSQWEGALDELAIYDKALTQPRIAAHFAAAKGM